VSGYWCQAFGIYLRLWYSKNMKLIGHEEILSFFGKAIKSGNLSHAYCLVGPEKVGKRTVAEEISAQLFKIDREKLKQSPDFFVVEQLFDEKEEKTKKDISIEQMQELRSYLSRRAYLSPYKVAIIDNAEKMNVKAANALLKTLEEPTEKTILFLITKDEGELPSTIVSRCQLIYFYPVAEEKISKALQALEKNVGQAKEMAHLAHGLPGLALSWQNDLTQYEQYLIEIKRFKGLMGKSFYEKLQAVEELFGDKSDHIKERGKLQEILGIWQIVWRESLLDTNFQKMSLEKMQAVKVYDKIGEARELLGQNVHPRLLIESVLMMIP